LGREGVKHVSRRSITRQEHQAIAVATPIEIVEFDAVHRHEVLAVRGSVRLSRNNRAQEERDGKQGEACCHGLAHP
jgi:hypothetical protein